MQESPQLWYNVPIIYLKSKKSRYHSNDFRLRKNCEICCFSGFFRPKLDYKLGPYLENAYSAQVPTAIQKIFKETDQRVSLLFNTLEGSALRLYPIPDDENNTWVSSKGFREAGYELQDTLYGNFIKTGFIAYMATLQNDKVLKTDFSKSQQLLQAIKATQTKYGGATTISEDKDRDRNFVQPL